MAEILYKYRSLQNFGRFVDILINQRLYCPVFTELNDPMEGFFWHSRSLSKKRLNEIMKEKFSYKICSLSQSWQDIGLWTFYADEGRGCCIGVEKDGSITSLIVKQPVHPLLDEEALRVISIMPRWFPAVAKDQNIRVKYTVPITFRL